MHTASCLFVDLHVLHHLFIFILPIGRVEDPDKTERRNSYANQSVVICLHLKVTSNPVDCLPKTMQEYSQSSRKRRCADSLGQMQIDERRTEATMGIAHTDSSWLSTTQSSTCSRILRA